MKEQMSPPKNNELKLKMKERFKALYNVPIGDQPFSICRVPLHIRKNNESYYDPRMVSIGPYHRKKEHLRAMDEHKWRYYNEYISTGEGQEDDYINKIRQMEPPIRARYIESFDLDENQFTEMMLLDSCFIIQLFIKYRFKEADPVRDIGWALSLLIADLLMLENQSPFFVLTHMYNIYLHGSVGSTDIPYGATDIPDDLTYNPNDTRPSLVKLFTESLQTMYNKNNGQTPNIPKSRDIKHLLHLFHILFVPPPEITPSTVPRNDQENDLEPLISHIELQVHDPTGVCGSEVRGIERSPRMIRSVTELQEFGVTFKKKKDFSSFLDISFKGGVLEIPYIVVEESIRSRYLNLIAFEQCRGPNRKHLTSYAVFMVCLISTSQDVIELQKCGIIENKLANAEEAAKFFNQLRDCAYIDFEHHYLKPVFVGVKNYCEAYWPKHRAKLCHDYFSSPWTIFSLGAAVLVLSIAIFRTIYFILHNIFKI